MCPRGIGAPLEERCARLKSRSILIRGITRGHRMAGTHAMFTHMVAQLPGRTQPIFRTLLVQHGGGIWLALAGWQPWRGSFFLLFILGLFQSDQPKPTLICYLQTGHTQENMAGPFFTPSDSPLPVHLRRVPVTIDQRADRSLLTDRYDNFQESQSTPGPVESNSGLSWIIGLPRRYKAPASVPFSGTFLKAVSWRQPFSPRSCVRLRSSPERDAPVGGGL
jgi:hypothetical protein